MEIASDSFTRIIRLVPQRQLANMPAEVLLQIFRHLPLKAQVRLGRTSKRLHDLSVLAISTTKCIDFTATNSELTADGFTSLLRQCSQNLKRILFPTQFKRPHEANEEWHIVRAIATCSYPKLEELKLPSHPMGDMLFGQIVSQCPNLRRFAWEGRRNGMTPTMCAATISKELSTVRLGRCNPAFVQSLASHCPNLKRFRFGIRQPVNMARIDLVFSHCGRVEVLDVDFGFERYNRRIIGASRFRHFWTLSSLRSLTLNADVDDSFVVEISNRFRRLQTLEMPSGDHVSQIGYSSLAALPDLRRLIVDDRFFIGDNETGIRQLAEAGRLEEVRLVGTSKLTPATFLSFVQFCGNLRRLSIRAPRNVESATEAVEIVRQMIGRKRDLDIDFFEPDACKPWMSNEVTLTLNDVNQSNGCTIRMKANKYFDERVHEVEV